MRTEQEMMTLILNFAENDDNIRKATMNGSRAVPSIPKDEYQDYAVVFACHDIQHDLDDRVCFKVATQHSAGHFFSKCYNEIRR